MNIIARYEVVVAWIIRIGLFIIPFIPLYIADSLFFPYITGKAFVFRLIVQVVFALWVWLAIFVPAYRPRKHPIVIAIAIFLFVVTLATIFSVYPERSFWSNFERMEGLVTYLHLFAYFLVITHVFRSRDWTIFFGLFLITGLIENVYAIMQHLGYLPSIQGGFRVDGTIGNPTYLAAFLIFIICFALLLRLRTTMPWLKYCADAIALFSLVTIYFTATRGVTIALILGAIFISFAYVFFVAQSSLMRRVALGFLAFVIILPSVLWLFRATPFVQQSQTLARLTSINMADAGTRFAIWNIGWKGFLEHPVLGWGPELYTVIFAKHYDPSLYAQEPWFDRSHNIVLDWLVNAGAIGFLAYLGIFGAAFYALRRIWMTERSERMVALTIGTLLIVYFTQNLFVFDNVATYISFFAILGYIVSIDRHNGQYVFGGVRTFAITDVAIPPLLLCLILLPVIGTLYFFNFKPLRSNMALMSALQSTANGDVQSAFNHFDRALNFGFLGQQEIREQLVRFGVATASSGQVPQELKLTILQRLITEAETEIAEHPHDPRMYLFLSSVFNRIGLASQGIATLERALLLAPNKQQIYFELADGYLQGEQYEKAIEILKRALALDTSYDIARVNLAAVYILAGQQSEADKILTERFHDPSPAYQTLIKVYRDLKKHDRVAATYQNFIKEDPASTAYRIELAKVLVADHKNVDAIAALTQAAQDIPSFKDQSETLIVKIKKGEAL